MNLLGQTQLALYVPPSCPRKYSGDKLTDIWEEE